MTLKRTVDDLISDAEFLAAKLKFLKEKFPDLKVQNSLGGWLNVHPVFSSKSINKDFTDLDFQFGYRNHSLKVSPFILLTFEHNGKFEDIKVHSVPKSSRLAYLTSSRDSGAPTNKFGFKPWKQIVRFGRVAINFKTHAFNSEKMMNDCQEKIMEFVGFHKNLELDTKHLDSRLKKLLVMQ